MRSDIDFKPYIVDFNEDGYDIKEPITKLSNKNIRPELIDPGVHKKNLEDIALMHDKLTYSELTNCLMSRYQKGESYVKRQLIPYLRNNNFINQDSKKQYLLKQLNTQT